jgi:HNH endonuclease/AP2 domain
MRGLMDKHNFITAHELQQIANYNATTGLFTWKITISNRAQAGKEFGSWDMYGYKTVRINQKSYKLHRLAWLYVHGEMPKNDIDHINGIRHDNRIENLRDVTRKTNLENQTRLHTAKKYTSLIGAYFDKRKNSFYSRISVNNKNIHLGSFDTEQKAHDAYIAAKRKLHSGNTF